MVTLKDIRALATTLPRTEEAYVREYVKYRVRGIVYVSVSPDEKVMGFGYPKEERAALIAGEPTKFFMPRTSDERFNWVRVWLSEIDIPEMRELVFDAWRMVVPKFIIRDYLATHPEFAD